MAERVNGSALASAIMAAIGTGQYPWWFPRNAYDRDFDYFAYGADFDPLPASQSRTVPIAIEADSAFFILEACLVETAVNNTTFFPNHPVMCNLFSGGSGRNLMNTPIHADNLFGTAQLPKEWKVPKLLLPNSTFNVQLANQEAVDRNIHVAFHGFKIFGWLPGQPSR